MPDTTTNRRPHRTAPAQQYRALATITYPTDYAARRRQVAGESVGVEWAKIAPGETVPEHVIAESPWLVEKHVVEVIADAPAPAKEGGE